ncbi:MAG: molybdopterin molybdotransferase MoeA [Lachnospiraceae bacterium]|nr:molybdopterin molybdotransferase MoeA [Lachnospiraceae bacterium]
MEQRYPTQISMEEGMGLLLSAAVPMDKEEVRLLDASGRVLACDVAAMEDIPPFDRSPLDGYAVRAADIAAAGEDSPVTLKIIGEVPAGYVAERGPQEGEAVKILTGAPIPEGADVVVRYEDTSFTEEEVILYQAMASGSNIVRAGEDVRAGQIVMTRGDILNAARIGVLAGLGYERVTVYKRPVVKILSTGDELVPVTEKLRPGKIRNSSAYMLRAFLQSWGMEAQICGIVKDDQKAIQEAIEACAEGADCVITTGGASASDRDLVLPALEAAGAQILFWKVRMKPGMATIAAQKKGTLVLGLSGNPSAAVAALFALCLPAFRKMCGRKDHQLPMIRAIMPEGFEKKSPGGRVLPGRLEIRGTTPCFITQKRQANGMISPWSDCDLIGIIPRGSGPLEKGCVIEAYSLVT